MNDQDTTKTNPESADQSTGDQPPAKERFEIPECCRHMMAQMMEGSFCTSGKRPEEQSPERGSNSPGVFGRLMIRMMKACCGAFTENHSRSAEDVRKIVNI